MRDLFGEKMRFVWRKNERFVRQRKTFGHNTYIPSCPGDFLEYRSTAK